MNRFIEERIIISDNNMWQHSYFAVHRFNVSVAPGFFPTPVSLLRITKGAPLVSTDFSRNVLSRIKYLRHIGMSDTPSCEACGASRRWPSEPCS